MNIKEIWKALESGKEVCWENTNYYLEIVDAKKENEFAAATYKNGKALRCTCKSNYFGSLLHKEEFIKCFINEEKSLMDEMLDLEILVENFKKI